MNLNDIDLNCFIDREEYQKQFKQLEPKLLTLQQKIFNEKIPVMLVFEGWSASGKGTQIGKLLDPLDPRYYTVFTMDKVNEDMRMRPYLWSYWRKTPEVGHMTIFDKSYHRIILDNNKKWNLTAFEKKEFFKDVNNFERVLFDGGCLVIKLFLHISRAEQKKRFYQLESKMATSWRIETDDWRQNDEYGVWQKNFQKIIDRTNSDYAPWHIIEANDKRFASIKICHTLIASIEKHLENFEKQKRTVKYKQVSKPVLQSVDLNKAIAKEAYKKQLSIYQKKMRDLGSMLYMRRRSVVIVYEGWDAAGKGGNIKRLTQLVDPRGYEVVSVPAPNQEELNHNYLWRFWRKIPKDGHLTIFDRSWYGRVMVERIEGFCTEDEWQRAYQEINEMEKNLYNHGIILFKFWIHIDAEEQLRRFHERMENPLKNYKITDEDWRNREKWDDYSVAVNDMLHYTNTSYAPWTIVESNSKAYARIKVLKMVTEQLQQSLF